MEHESTVVTPSVTPPLFCGPSPQATDLNSSGVFDYGHGAAELSYAVIESP
jgi:hypothetical protein